MKKIVSFLLFITCSNVIIAQIKPIKFGLVFKFDEASFDIKERKIAKYLFDTISITLDKKMDSISKTKSMCVDYIGYKDISKTDLLYVVHFYRGNSDNRKNVPIIYQFLIDNTTKDTIMIGSIKTPLAESTRPPEDDSVENNIIFLKTNISGITNLVENALILFVLDNYFPNCTEIIDYKRQKVQSKALVFLSYETTVGKNLDKKNIKIVDTFVNNQLLTRQLRNEKKLHNRQFLFYPYNKETKKIATDITIQLHLQEDGKGNYELKGDFKGKDINFKSPGGEDMQKSIKFNKKRFDKRDYTEFVHKLNYFIGGIYTYNILF